MRPESKSHKKSKWNENGWHSDRETLLVSELVRNVNKVRSENKQKRVE